MLFYNLLYMQNPYLHALNTVALCCSLDMKCVFHYYFPPYLFDTASLTETGDHQLVSSSKVTHEYAYAQLLCGC